MIYVDFPSKNRFMPRVQWCHMMTDGTLEELHAFARKIGLHRGWFQEHPVHPHYDLSLAYRTKAIHAGAQVVSSRDMIHKCIIHSEVTDKIPIPKHTKPRPYIIFEHYDKKRRIP